MTIFSFFIFSFSELLFECELIQCCNVDVVYIDFSRAFDSIVFSKLLTKLEHYGITGKLLHFINAYIHKKSNVLY